MTAAPVAAPPQSGADLLKRIQPRLKVAATFLCLRPDLLEAWEDLQVELQQQVAKEVTAGRLAGGKSRAATTIAKKVQELEEQISDTQIKFTMRGMDKPTYRLLKDRNPPRENNQIDLFAGYNTEAVRDEMVRQCLIDPVFDDCLDDGCNHLSHTDDCPQGCIEHGDCGSWDAFLLICNPSEWEELQRLAEEVNGRAASAPKSELAGRLLAPRSTGRNSRGSGG